jgi:hypothetical protein
MMRRERVIVNEMEFPMSRPRKRLPPRLQRRAMKTIPPLGRSAAVSTSNHVSAICSCREHETSLFQEDEMLDTFVVRPILNSVSHFIHCEARVSRLMACAHVLL